MDKLFVDTDPTSTISDKGTIGFIRYKVEPVFEYFLYLIGIGVILFGALNSLYVGYVDVKDPKFTQDKILTHMRIRLSETITLALTFILGAEIIKTFRVPNIFQLIKVTFLVLLRQLITYFLDQEVIRLQKKYPNL